MSNQEGHTERDLDDIDPTDDSHDSEVANDSLGDMDYPSPRAMTKKRYFRISGEGFVREGKPPRKHEER